MNDCIMQYGRGEADGYISTDQLFFDQKLTMGLKSAEFVAVEPKLARQIKESSDLWKLQQLTGEDYVFDGIMVSDISLNKLYLGYVKY